MLFFLRTFKASQFLRMVIFGSKELGNCGSCLKIRPDRITFRDSRSAQSALRGRFDRT